jgi:hypothetical protein
VLDFFRFFGTLIETMETMEDGNMRNYKFGLLDEHDQTIDVTNIDENNPDFAMELFREFAPKEGYHIKPDWYVVLLEDEDDPDGYYTCAETHPEKLSICMAATKDKDAVKDLKSCPNFGFEDDYEDNNPNIICKHCWGQGFYGVCDNNPKEEE